MKHLNIGIDIPVDIVTDTNAILAKKGAGKSYTASVLAEEMLAAGQRFAVIDPTDAWWGLRAQADGSPNGLPVVIFGGAHADLPLDEHMGAVVADLIVDRKVTSCILCTKGFESDAARIRFLTTFGARLFFRNRDPLHLFLDEADDYLPQHVTGDVAKLVNVWTKIVKQGRLQGLGVTLISQRAAVIHKSVLTQISTLFVLQTVGPQDIKAISEFIRAKGGSHDEMLAALPRLKKGEAYVYSPEFLEIDPPKKMQVRMRRTFNSGATPKVGERRIEPKGLAEVNLVALRESLASTIAMAKAEDPKALRARIAELEREIARKPVASAPERVEVPVLSADDRAALQAAHDTMKRIEEKLVHAFVAPAPSPDGLRVTSIRVSAARRAITPVWPKVNRQEHSGDDLSYGPHVRHAPDMLGPRDRSSLGAGERKVLTAIAQHGNDGCDREQLTVLTGYRRSSRDTYLQRLRAAGMIQEDHGSITATNTGFTELGDSFEPLPRGKALRDYWLGRLALGERRVLEVAIRAFPGAATRETITGVTGYLRSSRDTYIQRLSARKLVVTSRDGVTASNNLFDGGRA